MHKVHGQSSLYNIIVKTNYDASVILVMNYRDSEYGYLYAGVLLSQEKKGLVTTLTEECN